VISSAACSHLPQHDSRCNRYNATAHNPSMRWGSPFAAAREPHGRS
jgi:hypothetical protein